MIDQSDIIYEDNHLIAINKKPGMLVQGDVTGDLPVVDMVKEFLKRKYNKPGNVFAGLIHRIDRPVSGIVLLAKTSKALERMNKVFHEREVEKTYFAIVIGKVDLEGELVHWITKDEQKNKASVYKNERKESKLAKLSYKVVAQIGSECLLKITPETGRAHQIRAQFASIQAPIKGDLKYGYPTPNDDKSICLHAHQLAFVHPVQKTQILIEAPIPRSMVWNNFKDFK